MIEVKFVEKIQTRILNLKTCFRLWDNVDMFGGVKNATSDNNFAFWINKATNTRSEYITLIVLPRQKWLRERAWILRYTYTACLCTK